MGTVATVTATICPDVLGLSICIAMNLFSEEKQPLSLPDAEIVYYPNFLSIADADRFFEVLLKESLLTE